MCNASVIEINDDTRSNAEQTDCGTFIPRDFSGSLLSLDNVNYGGLVSQAFSGYPVTHPDVSCTVERCRFNLKGEYCEVDEITIAAKCALSSLDTYCITYDN
jgi:hypothetical protein